MIEKKYLSVKETSEYSGFCESIIRSWINQQNFYPAIKIGRRIIIDKEALDRWFSEHTINNP